LPPDRPRQTGFTLVEVLVATAVLAIGLLAALTAFSMAARVTGASTNDTVVSFLAHEKLAEIQLLGREQLAPGTTTGSFDPTYPDYSWELTVSRPSDLNVVNVDLTIYAPEGGKTRAFQFATAVF
jgi:general secretion pathway protein I